MNTSLSGSPAGVSVLMAVSFVASCRGACSPSMMGSIIIEGDSGKG